MSSLNDSLAATLRPISTTRQSAPWSAAIIDIRWRSPALLVLFALFSLYYLWTAQPYLTGPAPQHHLYNLLTDGFLAGQVSLLQEPPKELSHLQNPYDPAQNRPYHQLHDVVYYNGKYYVYHGPAPALTLFAAVRLVFGSELPDNTGGVVFTSLAFIAGCILLKLVIQFFYPRTPAWFYYLLCGGLGFCSVFPFLMRRSEFYEIAIAAGQFYLLSGLALLFASATSKNGDLLAALGGLSLGLATASRPTMIFAFCALCLPFVLPHATRRDAWRRVCFSAVPGLLIVVALLGYNFVRFGSPLEFGTHYQLCAYNPQTTSLLSPARWLGNMYLFTLYPPEVSSFFPFFNAGTPNLSPASVYMVFEPVIGVLWISPLLMALGFLIPVLKFEQGERRRALAVSMAVFCGIAGLLLLTDAAVMATMRYEADFAPILFIAAALTTAGLLSWSRGLSRSVLYSFTGAALAAGMVVNACIALTGYYDELRRKAPEQYAFLEHLFSPRGPKLLGMFPNGTTTGKSFLVQPDGTSALGVVCANAGSDPVVVFDSKPLPTSMSFDRNCMLSATVPPDLYTKPGTYPVFIRNSYGESNHASFVVAPAGP